MSDTMKTSCSRWRLPRRAASLRRVGVTLAVTLLATAMLLAGTSGDDAAVTDSEAQQISATQAATCVQATNIVHARAGRAMSFLLWAWARGSNTYIGWLWDTTSLREGPTGTWTLVESCGTLPTTSTTQPTTSTTRPTTTTTRPTTTTTRPTTTTTAPLNGAAIYAANCAGCHGADASGGPGGIPDLRGTVDAHGVEATIEVITNGRGAMPAWEGRLTPEQIVAVVDFLATLEGGDPHGHHGHHGGHDHHAH